MSGGASRQITDAEGNPVAIDTITGENQLVQIDTIHHRIHEGRLFSANELLLTLADDAFLQVLVQVPASTFAHMRGNFAAGGNALGSFYEATTFSDAGTPIVPFNRNRASSNLPSTILTETPTITLKGTLLGEIFVPGGGFLGSGGGEPFFNELILPEGNYLAELQNVSGAATEAHIQLDWYE